MPLESKINILLVDDRPEGIMALEAVLTHPRYNLVKANSGEEALGCVLKYDFSVILMDVQMPGMDGFETVNLIKQREKSKDIPVIFLTAISKESHYVQRGYESGAVDYIFKPFDASILVPKVAIFVDLYQKTQQIREQGELIKQNELRERVRQIATLQFESLNRYRHLADAIPHIIWKFQPDGTLEYCNRFWTEYSGLSQEQSSGIGWHSSVLPEDLTRLLDECRHAGDRGDTLETECRLLRAEDKTYRWHMFRAVPELSTASEVGSWIVTNTDIEDLKKIEKDLIQAKEESLAANQAKSAFLANMSHEIRTPLGVVLGYAELMANPDMPPDERLNCFSTIKKNGELLSGLIGDVLDLSKIEAGHLQIEKVKFSLPDFLCNAIESFQHQAADKSIKLSAVLESPIPIVIESDPMRLRQILFNIVGNAIKFTHSGEVTLRVKIPSLQPGHEMLQISVCDQGVGISAEQAKKLFKPFIQADSSTTRKFGGTGLGLSLSRKIARKLLGDVVLTSSEPQKGSVFVIKIPTGSLAGVSFVEELKKSKARPATFFEETLQLKGVRVLLVEDAYDNQVLVNRFLTRAGAEVSVADNGREAVNMALEKDFDLVLMDIQMPVLDGYQATRELRSKAFKKPIIALTAHALKEERERCLGAGCNDHLTKPINWPDLLNLVAKYSMAADYLGDPGPQKTPGALDQLN